MAQEQKQQDTSRLIEEVRRKAESERQQIQQEADEKVKELHERADRRIEQLRSEAEERLADELGTERDRIVGQADLDRRNRLLGVRQRLVREAFDAAADRLASMERTAERSRGSTGQVSAAGPGDYSGILRGLIREAVIELDAEECSLSVAEQDREPAEKLVKAEGLRARVEGSGNTPGTVIVTTTDGLRSIDNSMQTRLAHARRELAARVAEELFGGGSGKQGERAQGATA